MSVHRAGGQTISRGMSRAAWDRWWTAIGAKTTDREPEEVKVSCCPTCHEPADRTVDRGELTMNWCEGCRLEWESEPE